MKVHKITPDIREMQIKKALEVTPNQTGWLEL